jgi:hypothetical protein
MTARTVPQGLSRPGWGIFLGQGAGIGVRTVAIYAGVFTLYAAARAALAVVQAGPAELGPTVGAIGVALAYCALVFGGLMAGLAAPLGALTAGIVAALQRLLNRRRSGRVAAWIGAGVAAVLWLLLCLGVQSISGDRLTLAYPETFVFWLVFPGLFYVAAAVIGSRRLNRLDT